MIPRACAAQAEPGGWGGGHAPAEEQGPPEAGGRSHPHRQHGRHPPERAAADSCGGGGAQVRGRSQLYCGVVVWPPHRGGRGPFRRVQGWLPPVPESSVRCEGFVGTCHCAGGTMMCALSRPCCVARANQSEFHSGQYLRLFFMMRWQGAEGALLAGCAQDPAVKPGAHRRDQCLAQGILLHGLKTRLFPREYICLPLVSPDRLWKVG